MMDPALVGGLPCRVFAGMTQPRALVHCSLFTTLSTGEHATAATGEHATWASLPSRAGLTCSSP